MLANRPETSTSLFRAEDRGFTLMEVLVSIAIFAIIAASMSSAVTFNLRTVRESDMRAKAAIAAQAVIDDFRFQPIEDVPDSGMTSQEVVVEGEPFTVEVFHCERDELCNSPELRHLLVRVTRNDQEWYVTETVFTEF